MPRQIGKSTDAVTNYAAREKRNIVQAANSLYQSFLTAFCIDTAMKSRALIYEISQLH